MHVPAAPLRGLECPRDALPPTPKRLRILDTHGCGCGRRRLYRLKERRPTDLEARGDQRSAGLRARHLASAHRVHNRAAQSMAGALNAAVKALFTSWWGRFACHSACGPAHIRVWAVQDVQSVHNLAPPPWLLTAVSPRIMAQNSAAGGTRCAS